LVIHFSNNQNQHTHLTLAVSLDLVLTMARFQLRNDDDDDNDDGETSTTEEPRGAMVTNYTGRQNNPSTHVGFGEDSIHGPPEAPAFIVAYQRNGTPILVPYNPPKQPRKVSWWFWITAVAIVTKLVLLYGPPAPPSADETWEDFLQREVGALVRSATALLSVIPHVSSWISRELHADISQLLKVPPCPLDVPNDFGTSAESSIFSQSRAVALTAQALHAWKKEDKALILVFSGTVGVGKFHLAHYVAARSVCETSILQIRGRDYAQRHDLVAQLRQYILDGRGRVIILQHPEDMAPMLLFNMLEALESTPNLIVLITTHIGSRIIHRHVKTEGLSPSFSLDLEIRDEFDKELGHGVSEYVTAVAPFLPLSPVDMQQILIQKAHAMLNITITPQLAQQWTSPKHVEYLEWTSQGRTIQTFSSRGAKVLDEGIWRKLVAQMKHCGDGSGPHRLDWDEGEAVVQVCNADECEEVCRFKLTSY
jgi:hypothetical protein